MQVTRLTPLAGMRVKLHPPRQPYPDVTYSLAPVSTAAFEITIYTGP